MFSKNLKQAFEDRKEVWVERRGGKFILSRRTNPRSKIVQRGPLTCALKAMGLLDEYEYPAETTRISFTYLQKIWDMDYGFVSAREIEGLLREAYR